jgi:hypothetical protein
MNCTFNQVTGNTLVNVQKLQIYNTTSNGAIPLIPAALTGYTQAEACTAKSDWGWSNVLTGFTGNAYMEPCSANNSIEWNTNTSSPSADTLVWQYANLNTVASICSLYVNGQYQTAVSFPSTSSLWKTLKTPYTASQGTNTIRLTATNSKLYLDRFSNIKGPAILTQTDDALNAVGLATLDCSPNPVLSSAEVLVRLEKSDQIRLELVSIASGAKYNIYKGFCTQGLNTFNLHTPPYASGLYILQLHTSQGTTSHKVVIE